MLALTDAQLDQVMRTAGAIPWYPSPFQLQTSLAWLAAFAALDFFWSSARGRGLTIFGNRN